MLSIDQTFLDAKLGAKGLWRSGQISIGFAPSVLIPITERDLQNEFLNLPIDLSYMLSQSLYVGVQSGIRTPFEGIGDAYSIPVALGGLLMINPNLSAALAFSLDKVAGGGGGAGVDARSLSLIFGYTM
jgi:hypothetical protein